MSQEKKQLEQQLNAGVSGGSDLPPPYEQPRFVGYAQPSTVVPPSADVIPLRTWHSDIFGCFEDLPFCLLTYFFPCVGEYIVAKKANLTGYGLAIVACYIFNFLLLMLFYSTQFIAAYNDRAELLPTSFILYLMLCFLIIFAYLALATLVRFKIRRMRNIVGSSVEDCCWIYWCAPCATCQHNSELNFMENERQFQRA